MSADTPHHGLSMMLRTLKLPTFAAMHEQVALRGDREGWTLGQSLRHLCELEIEARRQRKIERLIKAAELPPAKTLATLDTKRWSTKVQRQIPALCEGDFLGRAENLLVFGLPGRGKSHLCAAIGYELVRRGRAVHFTSTAMLVQRLLRAKRDLVLERELDRLDHFDAVILDDIGYVQQERDEMEVLFTFLAARYERKSVIITSNLVFSQWDTIFKDAMTTAAAIDRLVHHSVILELTSKRSFRTDAALERSDNYDDNYTATFANSPGLQPDPSRTSQPDGEV
ncbi:MAG TPA: IS21-like element helper ATPase IstB [Polyangiales bacterium]|nr:IS21-like element helper ATPase IstB [Polyangiales bacterium]